MTSKRMIFMLPAGEYDEDFIKGMALATHLKVINPKEIDALFKQNLTHKEIAQVLLAKIKRKLNYL